MVIHMVDEKVFGYSICGIKVLINGKTFEDWTFSESNVTCKECLKIMGDE